MTPQDGPISPETLGAWLDGELPAEEARRVEAALAADPALASELAAIQRGDAALRAAFPASETADAALLVRLGLGEPVIETRREAEVIDLASARAARAAAGPARSWKPQGGRIAASIAVIAAVGLTASIWTSRQPATVDDAPYTALSDRTDAPRADVLVVLRDNVDAASVVGAAGGQLVGSRTSAGAWRVVATPGRGAALLARLRGDDRVVMAEPIDDGDSK